MGDGSVALLVGTFLGMAIARECGPAPLPAALTLSTMVKDRVCAGIQQLARRSCPMW
ncbi:hypothetical protein ACFWUW_10890 [Streptomyces sp. NPDC058655]|uniref:hypothetical protein n=1 Tax=Streptomyces sp. NPDC058655 TaxID=3346577 RepID=UPI00365C9BCB